MLSNILDRISFWSLFAVIVLLPVFFLPFTKIPIETSKGLLLVVGLAISIIFWMAARFSDGKVILPKSWILVSGFGIVMAFLLSALFSPALKVSLFGLMLDTGTFWFILAGFLLMLMSAILLRDSKNAKTVFWGVVASSAVLIVFQTLHLFAPGALSLGILGAKADNVLGSWNAFGIFAGFFAIISLFVLEFFSVSKSMKWLVGTLIALSVFLVAAVNFSIVWGILGIFALIIFVYKVSFSSGRPARTTVQSVGQQAGDKGENFRSGGSFPAVSFALTMVSLLFFMSGNLIGEFLPNRLGISNLEVRPSFSATMSVARAVLVKDPILGAGPNRFAEMWSMHKPAVINATPFWDASFDSGMGILPTFAVTTGALGILAWLVFLALLFISGAKSLFSSHKKNMPNAMPIAFFVASLYFFISSFFYSAGPAVFLLGFAFAGAFIGLSASSAPKGLVSLSLLDDQRKSFFSIFSLVLIMVVTAAVGLKYVERFASVPYFQKTFSAQSVPEAESNIAKALSLYSNDLYLRTYSQVYIAKMNSLAAKGSSITESEKAELQASFDEAVKGVQLAATYNPTNYLNFKALGVIYETVAPLGVAGAYDKAIEAYKIASDLNPKNPGLKLALAGASFAGGNVKAAKDYANEALALKRDYVDALVVLSQIAKSEGKNTAALSYAEAALSFSPQNKDLAQYVNSLKNNSAPSIPAGAPDSSADENKTD